MKEISANSNRVTREQHKLRTLLPMHGNTEAGKSTLAAGNLVDQTSLKGSLLPINMK
jgi:hypothetical protein